MRFAELALTSAKVAATRKRLEKIALLAEALRAMPEPELAPGASFLAGEMRQGRIGLGYAALRDSWTLPPAAEPTLEIADVDRTFTEIATASGAGSAKKRVELLGALLGRATAPEQTMIRGLLAGELRQGALESLVLEGVARAAGVAPASVRRAMMVSSDLGKVARAALVEGEAGLATFALTLFVPVQPMLAETADDVDDALEQLGRAAFELKVDGARVQVHKRGDEVRVYSRRMNEVTHRVPEVVEAARALPEDELILDGETIALAPSGRPYPFQTTMRRYGRKLDVEAMRAELPLHTFFFDVLRAGDRTLLGAPAAERFEALDALAGPALSIPRLITADPAEAAAFFASALEKGHEGAMAKSLDAPYEAGNRGSSWLKLKAVHTLDLVVIAVEWGSGRREGWLSNLHLAARDDASGQLVMLGKTFKGMTDEMLAAQTRRFLELETSREGHVVHVRPEVVVEVAIGDVQTSQHYPAGLALRFARVKRYRPDKTPAEADPLSRVRAIHAASQAAEKERRTAGE